ncbi:A-kinase anchor protein 14 [Cololabis saira]|uniref:A-kinase anchor protein 14 n=1 Tax=Cololabis saira TaxID=129043 RepID=UPI002AD28BC4|nr:A-kinase anchor protein 14 [Cololabis saira]
MDENRCDLIYPESSQLVKASLERRLRTQKPGDSRGGLAGVQWCSCGDFTVQLGLQQIQALIGTWGLPSCWLHSLDFLYTTEEQFLTFHHYRARFSRPTPREPVPGTASVYFAMEISKTKPQTLPVEVSFVVEANRLVHRPGNRLGEKWLLDVIESKVLVQRLSNL